MRRSRKGSAPPAFPIWGHDYDGDIRAPLVFSLLLIGGPYNGQIPAGVPQPSPHLHVSTGQRPKEEMPRARRRFFRRSPAAPTAGQ